MILKISRDDMCPADKAGTWVDRNGVRETGFAGQGLTVYFERLDFQIEFEDEKDAERLALQILERLGRTQGCG